jgi:hypothetical protein
MFMTITDLINYEQYNMFMGVYILHVQYNMFMTITDLISTCKQASGRTGHTETSDLRSTAKELTDQGQGLHALMWLTDS